MNIKDKINKLHTMYLHGNSNESENAKYLIDKLCIKYNLDLDEIIVDDAEKDYYDISFKNNYERKLMLHVIHKVLGGIDNLYYKYVGASQRKSHNTYKVLCTKSEIVEIQYLYEFYCKLFEEELSIFIYAFIHKHKIYTEANLPSYDVSEDNVAEIIEEQDRLSKMASVMKDASPNKLITTKN